MIGGWRELAARWRRLGTGPRATLGVGAVVGLAAALALAVLALSGRLGSDSPEVEPAEVAAAARAEGGGDDPFAYGRRGARNLERRAADGLAHVLYEKSPGGVIASARRTARFRPRIERAAERTGADPELIEAMVFLESAGRPEVIAGDDPEAASGLAQILAETSQNLLGMQVDLGRSRELTQEIAATESRLGDLRKRIERNRERRAAPASPREERRLRRKLDRLRQRASRLPRRERSLRRERRRVDERFDPDGALAGMARYLEIAGERFGRDDLAVASYHMGIGNLEAVIRAYVGQEDASPPVGELVEREDLPYARIFFDSSPLRNPEAWELLAGFGDDSSTYLWRVLASREIMRLYREDRDELRRLIELHDAKATAEEVFHPEGETEVFADPGEIEAAREDGELVAIPPGRRLGFRVGPQLGREAEELGEDRGTYRALRPEALAALVYLASRVREIEGGGRLTVTSAVRDRGYQEALVGSNPEATSAYSLHTTGWSFDILRRYRSRSQAQAFQFMLDRLKALGVIDYAVEPAAIHITVSSAARPLLEGG